MRQFLLLLVFCSLMTVTYGCGGRDPAPKADPNFKPTTNPSDIVVPDELKKMAPNMRKP